MKALLQKMAGFAGFEVRKVHRNRKKQDPHRWISRVPESNFENISLVMECFTGNRRGGLFVQVGANDGVTSDSVYFYVKREVMESVLVEPIPSTFSKLEKFYEGTSKLRMVNAAIGAEEGDATIYAVRNEGRWRDNAWATQLASFDRNHLVRHGIADEEVEEHFVKVMTLSQLLEGTGRDRIDVLQIDVEGLDHEIVKCALKMKKPPGCISFEFCQFLKTLPQGEVDELYSKLAAAGYKWVHDRINTLAVQAELIPTGTTERRSEN